MVDTRSEDTDGHTLRPVLVDTRSDFTDGLALWPKQCQLYGRETLRPSRKIQIPEIDRLYGRFNFMATTVNTLRTVILYGRLRPLHGHALWPFCEINTDAGAYRCKILMCRWPAAGAKFLRFGDLGIPLDLARRRRENFDI